MGSPGKRNGKSSHEVKARKKDGVCDKRWVRGDSFLEGDPLTVDFQTHLSEEILQPWSVHFMTPKTGNDLNTKLNLLGGQVQRDDKFWKESQ